MASPLLAVHLGSPILMKLKTALLVPCLVSVTRFSQAQLITPVAPAKGAYSISFSAQWFQQSGYSTITTFRATPAYFVCRQVEVRLPVAFLRGTGANENVYGIGARWHFLAGSKFLMNPLVDPFLGLEFERASTSHAHEDFSAAQIGVNYFVANNVAVTGIVQFGRDQLGGSSQSTFDIAFGFSVFFAGK
jgi:hypothetical protein